MTAPATHKDRRQAWTLVATGLGLFMVFLDATIVNVALPDIQQHFSVGETGLHLVAVLDDRVPGAHRRDRPRRVWGRRPLSLPADERERDDVVTVAADDGMLSRYETRGVGNPPLVFVDGWCSNLRHWDEQVRHFAPRHCVVTVDRRGRGPRLRRTPPTSPPCSRPRRSGPPSSVRGLGRAKANQPTPLSLLGLRLSRHFGGFLSLQATPSYWR